MLVVPLLYFLNKKELDSRQFKADEKKDAKRGEGGEDGDDT